jgi:lipid-binding SYLF domain-containing protein
VIKRKTSTLWTFAALTVGGGAVADMHGKEQSDAHEQVDEARQVVEQMRTDADLASLIEQAHGVFIVPDYAKAAAVVGGQGGEGVALLRTNGAPTGEWSAPIFYDFGGASLGADIGIKAGSIAMLLMSEDAADMFRNEDNNWSLDANAGLTIIDYSAATEASAGQGDVIVWSDTEGAFAGVDVGIGDINRDQEENAEFYGENVDVRQVLSGEASSYRADELRAALRGS